MAGLLDLAQGKPKSQEPNYWTGFAQSALSSIPELFGVEPSLEVEEFRARRPLSGFATQILGSSVPYLGWAKASKAVAPFETFIQGLGNVERAPILTRAAQEITRYAPFEGIRAGIASTAGGENFGEELLSSGVNLLGAGAIGGVFGAIGSAGKLPGRKPLIEIAPSVDPDAPLQVRLRQLQTAISEGSVTDSVIAQNRLASWIADARSEIPVGTQKHLRAFEGEGGLETSRQIERLFFKPDKISDAIKNNKGSIVRRFVNAKEWGFVGEDAWRAAATDVGLPDDFVFQGQFFRYITPQTRDGANTLEKVAKKLNKIGDFYIGKEVDGNYAVLKRIEAEPEVGKPTRWLAFKTDDPSKFSQELRTWKKLDARWDSWVPPDTLDLSNAGEVLAGGARRNSMMPLVDYTELQKTGKLGKALENLTGPLGQGVQTVTSHYLTPTMNQFSKSPLANWIWGGAKDLWELASLKANDLMLGQREIKSAKEVAATIWGWTGTRPNGQGILGRLNSLSDDQIKQMWRLDALRPSSEQLQRMAASGEIDEAVYEVFTANAADVRKAYQSLNATRKALGKKAITLTDGHSGIPRQWAGSLKQGLMDESGRLVAVADANNMKALENRAAFIEEALANEGITGLKRGTIYTGDGKLPPELRIFKKDPRFASKDSQIRGFRGDFGQWEKLTRQELLDSYNQSLQARYRAEADEAFRALFQDSMKKLFETDPRTAQALEARISQLKGEPGKIEVMINKVIDPMLAPILGKGSAGKIVDSVNEAFWHLQLGALNVGYPAANMAGIFQTVLPELAFVMNGVPERLAPYYGWQLVSGAKGPRGIMSFLDPVKISAKGIKSLFNMDAQLLRSVERAISDGVIDPKFLEEFAGQSAGRIAWIKDVVRGRESFVDFVKAISSWMPSASERFTRAMSFTIGHEVGKDILGLTDDALYAWAKKFVDRTMYSYSQADRSMVLTSPVGRLFGSMKNWVSHYISNMMVYAGEATRGNIAPLGWQMATTGMVGGLAAVPLLPTIAEAYAEQVEEKKLVDWIYSGVGQRAGDALFFGLPAGLGMSLSSATASPIRDANMLFSLAISDRAKAMGRSFGAAVDHWQATGEHPASSELARGAFARAFAPKGLYRYLQVYDNEGLESLSTGYPIVDQLSPMNKLLYVSGFQPSEIERGFAVFEEMLGDKNSQQKTIRSHGQAMAEALKAGDSEAIDRIVTRAIAEGVDLSSVMRSANARLDKDSKGLLERNFDAALRQSYTSVIGEK